jgi:mannose-1-phosphate guanylyltransferase
VKGVLLAAGLGTRLRPITEHTPKCLVTIDGRALLDIWLDALAEVGVTEVLVNLHHLPDQVEAHLALRDSGPLVRASYEPVLLGSAGTLRANRGFLTDEDMFLVINADNLTDFDLGVLIDSHRQGGTTATITAFVSEHPSECGVIETANGIMTEFEEKPAKPRSNLVNAGMYAFGPDVLSLIDGPDPRDIGHHLLPKLVDRARVLNIGEAFFADIGSLEALENATVRWPQRVTA